MRRQTLRTSLILAAWGLPFTSGVVWWLLGYGPWIGSTIDVSNQLSLFMLMALQGFMGGITFSAICLWAAHNLGPLSFASRSTVSRFCFVGILASIICVVLSIMETVLQYSVFDEEVIFGFGDLAYIGQFVIYGLANIFVLLFARFQLKQQLAGEKIQDPTLAETFS